MIVIVLILATLYTVVFLESRQGSRTAVQSFRRTILASGLLAVSVFLYSYYQLRTPPNVNYWRTGWIGLIRQYNAELESKGSPNRIPGVGQ